VSNAHDDVALLDAWKSGDETKGQVLLRRYFVPLLRFFRNKAPDVAEDLAQRTFVALLEGRERLQEASSFRAYVFGVARNQLLLHLRSAYRNGERFDVDAWSFVQLSGGARGAAIAEARRELLRRALQAIPVDYQIALELFYFEDLSIAEIADVLEVRGGAIKTRLSRARALLRNQLAELSDERELLDSVDADLDRWIRSLPTALRRDRDPSTSG
jgi:RNA polymerase sigma-70 factor (ECF subfamily)